MSDNILVAANCKRKLQAIPDTQVTFKEWYIIL